MKRGIVMAICAALVLGGTVFAQEKKGQEQEVPSGWASKVVEIKHRDVKHFFGILAALGVKCNLSPELKVIALSGPPDMVEAAAKAIQRLDVPAAPPKNIELTTYLLVASEQPVQTGSVPAELDSVTKQLRSVFSFQGFRLVDTVLVRVRDGETVNATTAGPPPADAGETSATTLYEFRFEDVSVTLGEDVKTMRIGKLRFSARVPVGKSIVNTGFNTGIDVREGQSVVVGKASLAGTNNAMILVVRGRVVD